MEEEREKEIKLLPLFGSPGKQESRETIEKYVKKLYRYSIAQSFIKVGGRKRVSPNSHPWLIERAKC